MSIENLSKLVQSRNFVVTVKSESHRRKGKVVTILDGFPKNEVFLKELLKELKQTLGAGGTYSMAKRDGVLEIQGDHRARVGAFLDKLLIKHK